MRESPRKAARPTSAKKSSGISLYSREATPGDVAPVSKKSWNRPLPTPGLRMCFLARSERVAPGTFDTLQRNEVGGPGIAEGTSIWGDALYVASGWGSITIKNLGVCLIVDGRIESRATSIYGPILPDVAAELHMPLLAQSGVETIVPPSGLTRIRHHLAGRYALRMIRSDSLTTRKTSWFAEVSGAPETTAIGASISNLTQTPFRLLIRSNSERPNAAALSSVSNRFRMVRISRSRIDLRFPDVTDARWN
jgi:hypothetical protein